MTIVTAGIAVQMISSSSLEVSISTQVKSLSEFNNR